MSGANFIEAEFRRLITEATVPGLAAAVLRPGQLDRYLCCGVRSARSDDPVDENTVFEAASLTKPVFAHLVLQLADAGRLSLDEALGIYLPNYLAEDPRASAITARHILSHSGGFPNWRSADFPLKTYFPPGERFSYSGEGFLYLQKAVEAITGETANVLLDQMVFQPLGMRRSSCVWHPRFDDNRAERHDAFGRPALSHKPGEANAAWSLQTTAADFARFLLAVLDGSRLTEESAALWPRPQIEVRHHGIQCLGPDPGDVETGVAWGLGWGLEPAEEAFFHWGDNGPATAFTIGSMQEGAALVIFANGASGLSIMPDLVAHFMPGARPSFAWLDYARHDSPSRCLLRAARERGIAAVWGDVEHANLGGDDLRWIAQGLTAAGREDDSRWLRERIEQIALTSPEA